MHCTSASPQSQISEFVRCQSVEVQAKKGCTSTPCTCDLFCPRSQGHKCKFVGYQSATRKKHFGILQPYSRLLLLHEVSKFTPFCFTLL
jgi:hypothetical protein